MLLEPNPEVTYPPGSHLPGPIQAPSAVARVMTSQSGTQRVLSPATIQQPQMIWKIQVIEEKGPLSEKVLPQGSPPISNQYLKETTQWVPQVMTMTVFHDTNRSREVSIKERGQGQSNSAWKKPSRVVSIGLTTKLLTLTPFQPTLWGSKCWRTQEVEETVQSTHYSLCVMWT